MKTRSVSVPLPFSTLNDLTPISYRSSAEKGHQAAVYTISETAEGEAFIMWDAGKLPPGSLTTADQRVISEIIRIQKKESPFGLTFGTAGAQGVSLARYPYLMSMIPTSAKIIVPSGEEAYFDDSYAAVLLSLEASADGKSMTPILEVRAGEDRIRDFLFLTDNMVLAGDRILTVSAIGRNFVKVKEILQPFAKEQTEIFLSLFMSYFDNVLPEINGVPARMSGVPERAVPTIVLEKVARDKALYIRLIATVESLSADALQSLRLTRLASVNDEGGITVRDIVEPEMDAADEALYKLVCSSSPTRQSKKNIFREDRFYIIPEETASPFLLDHLADVLRDYRLIGSEKLKEYQVTAAMPKLNLRLSSGIDFLEGDAVVELGDDKFSIASLLNQYSRHRYVLLSDGNRAIMDPKYISRLERVFRHRRKGSDKVRISFFDLPEVEDLLQEKLKGSFASKTREVFEGFNNLHAAKLSEPAVKATLRDYQKQGVKWLKYLCDHNLGGCLADDMGLGKTLQTISVLTTLYPGSDKPTLIIMPRSLLFNWEKEFEKFAPQVRVSTYYGPDRDLKKALDTDVMITTYAVARNDVEQLREVEFEYVILDESQNIKNVGSQTAQAVVLLNARHRLALSGTPMENNLTEIYSLFRFLNPTMFGTFEDFNASYTYPIQKNGDKDATESLRRRIFPFILRRLKRNVLTELPERIDRTLFVEMSKEQKSFYEER